LSFHRCFLRRSLYACPSCSTSHASIVVGRNLQTLPILIDGILPTRASLMTCKRGTPSRAATSSGVRSCWGGCWIGGRFSCIQALSVGRHPSSACFRYAAASFSTACCFGVLGDAHYFTPQS